MSSNTICSSRGALALLVPGLLLGAGPRRSRSRCRRRRLRAEHRRRRLAQRRPRDAPAAWSALAGSVARPNEYYFGTTGGGVWKTTDGGKTAVPVTDRYFGGTHRRHRRSTKRIPTSSGPAAANTPFAATSPTATACGRPPTARKTWQYMGLKETQQISRIVLDPRNSDVAYVAALGHVWGATPDRGVYKTTDGGKSWKKILFRNDSTGAIELVMDPSQSRRAVRRALAGGPQSVAADQRRHRRRNLQDDRRRRSLDGDHPQHRACRPASSATSAWRSRRRSRTASGR